MDYFVLTLLLQFRIQYFSRKCQIVEQDLVFSVKLHLALRPLPLDHIPYPFRPLSLRRYPKSFIPKALSHIPYPLYQTPCPLTPSTVSFEKI